RTTECLPAATRAGSGAGTDRRSAPDRFTVQPASVRTLRRRGHSTCRHATLAGMRTPVQTLNRLLVLPGLFFALLFGSLQVAHARDYPARAEVRAFIDELAERHSFDPVQLVEVFSRVQRSDAAVRLMTPPPRGG